MNAPRRIWLLPGMGADHRLYQRVTDVSPLCHPADWIPHERGEDLIAYARRMIAVHGITSGDAVVGVSMGGMVAAQIGQQLGLDKVLLVSSATNIRHLHPILRHLSPLGRLVPFGSGHLVPEPLVPGALQRLALCMYQETAPSFLRWSCEAIRRWPGVERTASIIQIHGTRDPVFPIARQRIDVPVPGAGHLLVLTHPGPVRQVLASWGA